MSDFKLQPDDLPLVARIGSRTRSFPHYNVRKTDKTTIEGWVPAVEGQEFAIWCKGQLETPKQKSLDIRAVFWLDDAEMDPAVFRLKDRLSGKYGCIAGQPVGVRKFRPFTFKKLVLTDKKDARRIESANTITIELEWGKARRVSGEYEYTDLQDDGPVHEKSIKAGNPYATGLGDIKPCAGVEEYQFTPVEDSDLPTLKFVFRYASQEWLEAQGIAPPPKSESPPKKFESLSPKMSESSPPRGIKRGTRKRASAKAKADIIEVVDVKSESDSDNIPTTSNSKRRKFKAERDIKSKRESKW